MGVNGEEALERIVKGRVGPQPLPESGKKSDFLGLPVNLNRADYIQVPQHNIIIAKAESLNGLDFYDTLEQLKSANLRAPKINQFVHHYMNVKRAAEGKKALIDAGGNVLSQEDAEDLWNYLSSGHRGGCWTWLDALFEKNTASGEFYMKTDLRVVTNGNNKVLQGKPEELDNYVKEDCYVGLEFTKEGLPINKSPIQKYEQVRNIRFYHPREGAVARFGADSDRAFLVCVWDPSYRDSNLGVFACAEGTAPKKSRGSK